MHRKIFILPVQFNIVEKQIIIYDFKFQDDN